MSLKHLITSTCIAVFLSGSLYSPASARHVVNDPAANMMDAAILVQDLAAVVLKVSDLAEFIKRNISFGDLGAISSSLDYSKNVRGLVEKVNVSTPTVPGLPEFKNTFEQASKDAGQMKALVSSVLPAGGAAEGKELLTAQKEAELKKIREAIRNAAIADAYATSTAYLSKKTAAAKEVVQPAQNTAAGAETLQAKQAAANNIALARLNELIESNVLIATDLQVRAAEAMGNLPSGG